MSDCEYLTDPLALAVLFHHTYEKLAPNSGYVTRQETRIFDPESPNGKLMIAVCAEVQDALSELRHQVEDAPDKLTTATGTALTLAAENEKLQRQLAELDADHAHEFDERPKLLGQVKELERQLALAVEALRNISKQYSWFTASQIAESAIAELKRGGGE